MTSLDASRIAVKSLGRAWTRRMAVNSLGRTEDQQDGFEISSKSLDTSRIAVKSLGIERIPAE